MQTIYRESAVHDIVDEDKRMMKTYQIIKDAQYVIYLDISLIYH